MWSQMKPLAFTLQWLHVTLKLLYNLGRALGPLIVPMCRAMLGSLPWPETKCYLIGTLGVSQTDIMQLWLLDFDQGASRGLEWADGSNGSMLGEAGVQPNFWEQMSEPSYSKGRM